MAESQSRAEDELGVVAAPLPIPEEASEGAPDWIVTFADLMSLLLCFFVLLLSFSRMDQERFKELAGSLQEAFGVQREVPAFDIPRGIDLISREFSAAFLADVPEQLRATVKRFEDGNEKAIEVQEGSRGVRVTMDGSVLFAPGRATLHDRGKDLLVALLPILKEVTGEIHIEGHTDNIPMPGGIGETYDGNWELSYRRALAVLRFVADTGGLPADRLAAIGRGPSKPLASNVTTEGRSRNRRVELALFYDSPPRAGAPSASGDSDDVEVVDAWSGLIPPERVPDSPIPEVRFSPTEHTVQSGASDLFPE